MYMYFTFSTCAFVLQFKTIFKVCHFATFISCFYFSLNMKSCFEVFAHDRLEDDQVNYNFTVRKKTSEHMSCPLFCSSVHLEMRSFLFDTTAGVPGPVIQVQMYPSGHVFTHSMKATTSTYFRSLH